MSTRKINEDLINAYASIGEQTYTWEQLTEGQRLTVATVHATAMKKKPQKILKLLNMGHPKIIFGAKFKYCRIHPDSVQVIQVILKQYLSKQLSTSSH